MYAYPQPPVEAPSINDSDLEIFTRDMPFNFTIKQALERLDDPGVLAKVTQL
jgi:hypothetical protein